MPQDWFYNSPRNIYRANRVHQKYGVAHNNILFVKYIINEVGETV